VKKKNAFADFVTKRTAPKENTTKKKGVAKEMKKLRREMQQSFLKGN